VEEAGDTVPAGRDDPAGGQDLPGELAAKILRRVELHAVGLLQPLTYPVISEEPVLHRIRLIHPTGLRLLFPGTDHHYPPTRLSHGKPRVGSLR
jgi:hypothetical protein